MRPIIVLHNNDKWGMYLIDYSNIADWNNNYTYILTVINYYLRYA